MTRTRRSAKTIGTAFEALTTNYLRSILADDRIERRARNGSKDRGDIAGIRIHGQRVVIECKNTSRLAISEWLTETEIERGNDDALAGVIIHKRHGKTNPAAQLVTMTLQDFAALLAGYRHD